MQKSAIYIDIATREHITPTGDVISRSTLYPAIERGQWAILCFTFVERVQAFDGMIVNPVSLDGAASYILVADNNFRDDDYLMVKSLQNSMPFDEEDPTSNMVNIAGDWIDGGTADPSLGQLSFRVNSDTVKFAEVMGDEAQISTGLYLGVKKYMPGISNPSTIAWARFRATNTIRDWSSAQAIPPEGVEYISFINAALSNPLEYQYSSDGVSWHSELEAHADIYFRIRLSSSGSTWSASQPIAYGRGNSLAMGTVETGDSADASITGESPNQVLNLVLPKGDTGPANSLSIGTVEGGDSAGASITGEPPEQTLNLVLPRGEQGIPGPMASLSIGIVEEGDSADASIDSSGEDEYALNLILPRGPMGYGLNLKGDWSFDSSYSQNESTRYDGAIWRSLQDGNTGKEPGEYPTYWELVVQDGAAGVSITRIYNNTDDPNDENWHEVMTADDTHFRESTDHGITWGAVMPISPTLGVIALFNVDAVSDWANLTSGASYSTATNAKYMRAIRDDGIVGEAYLIHNLVPQNLRVVFAADPDNPSWHANLISGDRVVKFYNLAGTVNKTIIISDGTFEVESVQTCQIANPWHLIYTAGDHYMRVSVDSGGTYSTPIKVTGDDAPEPQVEFSANAVDWSTSPTNAIYQRWSMDGGLAWTAAMQVKGSDGAGLKIDAIGTLANRDTYDAAAIGFIYLATDVLLDTEDRPYNLLYMRTTSTQGTWSEGAVAYIGPTGATGPASTVPGPRGADATIIPDLVFASGDIVEDIEYGGSLTIDGIKAIAQVEIYDANGDGIAIERGDALENGKVIIKTKYADNETVVYFGALDVTNGGRVRFAQGSEASSVYLDGGVSVHEGTPVDGVYTPTIHNGNLHYLSLTEATTILAPDDLDVNESMAVEVLTNGYSVTVKGIAFSGARLLVTFWMGFAGVRATVDEIL